MPPLLRVQPCNHTKQSEGGSPDELTTTRLQELRLLAPARHQEGLLPGL